MTKRILSLILFLSLAAINIGLIVVNFRPAGVWFGPNSCYFSAIDFITRCNEVNCLLDGVNPFYVWNETIDKKPYYSNIHKQSTDAEHPEIINAYTPWSYTVLMPIAVLPRQVAWRIYHSQICLALMLLCTAAILLMAQMGRAFEIVVNAALPSLNGFAAIVCSWSSTAAFILVFIWLMSLPRSSNASA